MHNTNNTPVTVSYDLYLFVQLLIYAIILFLVQTTKQHLFLCALSYINFIIIERIMKIKLILKLLYYMIPSLLGFAMASFVFTENSAIKLSNCINLSLHFFSIIFISFIYTTSINFNSLIFYCLKKKWISLAIGFVMILVEMTTRVIMQDWKKIYLVYRMRGYKKRQIFKPIFLLLLNTISYAQDMAINTFVRGIVVNNEFMGSQQLHEQKQKAWQGNYNLLTTTVAITKMQYIFLLLSMLIPIAF